MECQAPSEYLSPKAASKFGQWAENVISQRYLVHRGRTTFFPLGFEDFRDPSELFRNWDLYIAFVTFHNPWFGEVRPGARFFQWKRPAIKRLGSVRARLAERLLQYVQVGLVKVPDLMTHSPAQSQLPASRTEYYEIKPNSDDGLRKGQEKIFKLDGLHAYCKLPYSKGVIWSPDEHVTLYRLPPFFKISLHYKRIFPGLVVYEICVDDPLKEFAKDLLIALIILLLTILLRGVRIPRLPGGVPGPATA